MPDKGQDRGQDMREQAQDIHLSLRNVSVGYRGKALVQGIGIGVRRGEIVTLIGPNGSGKSTILKSITRQLELIDGQVLLSEGKRGLQDLRDLTAFAPEELARRMAVVLTGRIRTELMTCRDVAAMGRYPYTGRLGILSDRDERKVEEALEAVHALHLAGRPFDAVSDGERQRILLARAICQEPEIIVLDEPTSYLDIRHKLELLFILYGMSRAQGITVVMSLHEIDLARKVSDRVLCVRGGGIFAAGDPAEILDDETVRRLYDLDPSLGAFDARTGSLRLSFLQETGTPAAREPYAGAPLPRLVIAAPGSGSGKTLITCGLLRLLQRSGHRPAAFKCGPDYIDPMFHRQVLGIPSRNLDAFFLPDGGVCGVLERAVRRHGADIALIEGVMGYFDGTGKSGTEASTHEVAVQTRSPVLLVVDARGMGRSVVPLVKGLAAYERGMDPGRAGQIRGVFLNRIAAGMFPVMKKWIEEEAGLTVIGYLPQEEALVWESRHLGLLQPEEIRGLHRQIDALADRLAQTADLAGLLEIACGAPALPRAGGPREEAGTPGPEACDGVVSCLPDAGVKGEEAGRREDSDPGSAPHAWAAHAPVDAEAPAAEAGTGEDPGPAPRIAVARDEAFSFYYEDNLELLRECGARTVFFSPLHDGRLPDADGLLLGGGYPELHAEALAANLTMKESVRAAAAGGMPVLAECGGFMYLQEVLETGTGEHAMCGVLPGTCRKMDRLVRFGYLELSPRASRADDGAVRGENGGESGPSREEAQAPPGAFQDPARGGGSGYLERGHCIRGHEFHYYASTADGSACIARRPGRDAAWDCMVVRGDLMAGFPHLYYRSDPAFAVNFVDRCRAYRTRRYGMAPERHP